MIESYLTINLIFVKFCCDTIIENYHPIVLEIIYEKSLNAADRIIQELAAEQIDSWQEYALLKIDNADVEPIYLLKMTCPSTGFIHALRVSPNLTSAREAVCWVNWDIDPDKFSVETRSSQ